MPKSLGHPAAGAAVIYALPVVRSSSYPPTKVSPPGFISFAQYYMSRAMLPGGRSFSIRHSISGSPTRSCRNGLLTDHPARTPSSIPGASGTGFPPPRESFPIRGRHLVKAHFLPFLFLPTFHFLHTNFFFYLFLLPRL